MPRSAEDSIRVAILTEPHAFGLTISDTNPMLLYQLRKDDPKYCEQGTAELWKLCFDGVNALLYDKVLEVFACVSWRKDELVLLATAGHADPPELPVPSVKTNSNGHYEAATVAVADKLTTKQLRYMGYLYRQLGEEPDYKNDIVRLSQVQATMRIKELEKRLGK